MIDILNSYNESDSKLKEWNFTPIINVELLVNTFSVKSTNHLYLLTIDHNIGN